MLSGRKRSTMIPSEIQKSTRVTRRSLLLITPQKTCLELPKTPLVLSKEVSSPKTPENDKPASALDPVMEKIKRDLNSPSATARIRGQRALKSPGFRKANYQVFDVAHEEQDIITVEERQPYKPKTIREIFESCRIYVEVRTGDDNRSAGIKAKLLSDGIKVNEKLYKDTTHVIFKDGLLSTYKQAKKLNIPITNILWVETCKAQRRLVDPSAFKISNFDRYEHPELYPRMRRQKSMQPEISKQIIFKPKAITQNPPPTALDQSISTIESSIDGDSVQEIDEEGTIRECAAMELTMKADVQTSRMEMHSQFQFEFKTAEKVKSTNRRLTTFTPRPMEETKCAGMVVASVDRRRTIYSSSLLNGGMSSTPNGATGQKLVFNSANRIGHHSKRRSIMDISMNIFELNCQALKAQSEKEREEKEMAQLESSTSESDKVVETQIPKPAGIKKRKLFNIDLDDTITECKENLSETLNETKRPKLNKSIKEKSLPKPKEVYKSEAANRRKTISFFKTDKPAAKLKPVTQVSTPKFIVCTNMSASDKQAINAAILKLGGYIESEVSEKTTHVVTPSVERTMNLLRGVIRACYIVNLDWVHESEKSGKFLDPTIFQHSICNTQKINERLILGKRFKNHVFTIHGPYYIQKETIDNERKIAYLKEIIQQCGGVLTRNRFDAKIIISDHPIITTFVRPPTVVVSTYIFDAAMQGRMIPTAKYAPKKINN